MNADQPNLEAGEPSSPRGAVDDMGLRADFIMALRFFSRLPTGSSPHQTPNLGRIAMALPLASVAIGIGPALLLVGGALTGLPSYFAAALAVAAMVLASGAMAEDALADAADGLFGGHSIERRLDIMKDSRHGTYGVAALCLFILLRVTGLGAIAAVNPLAAGSIWLAASIVGRSGALWVAVALPPARRDGAAATAGQLPARNFSVGAVFAALLLFLLAGPATSMFALVVAVMLAVIVMTGWAALCKRLVGGQTGDLIGALGALVEVAVLAALLPFV
ncbi:MAG: adenosylcobinamide-GDP ribazoletransferase [Alphaproteobacteria bacterium]|nr:adenosylcobinamide-GDP ribazoletransferase [Alphaproteobacteria bacterium]MBU1563307.1 adenosylcobinamide-GDP ribazoletransferase [Alphaproteobacteria bacterium]MBU2302030.1 adenosylcobinamide-GDP ribazoletransferase [Alphaproteobacteria bacterium]MBU2367286.1 adenosylcobinamide-GDP ribazoletransferase [Alphaproteobacteria bacterium]